MVLQPTEEQTKKGAEQERFEVTTGINDNHEQSSAVAILESSAEIFRASKVISQEQSEFEKIQQLIDDKFNYLQSSITDIRHASANAIEQIRAEIRNGSVSL